MNRSQQDEARGAIICGAQGQGEMMHRFNDFNRLGIHVVVVTCMTITLQRKIVMAGTFFEFVSR